MESPYKIKVEPKAKDDLREAVAYYVSVAPSKIAKNFLKKYPYLVFYKVDDTKREIIIKAIFNTNQDTSKYPK